MLEEKQTQKIFWFREIILAKQNQIKDFLSVALEPDLLKKLSSDKLDKGIRYFLQLKTRKVAQYHMCPGSSVGRASGF